MQVKSVAHRRYGMAVAAVGIRCLQLDDGVPADSHFWLWKSCRLSDELGYGDVERQLWRLRGFRQPDFAAQLVLEVDKGSVRVVGLGRAQQLSTSVRVF